MDARTENDAPAPAPVAPSAVPASFRDVITLWPTAEEFGADIGIDGGLARNHKRRDSLPSEYWEATIAAAQRRGYLVTADLLTAIAAKRRSEGG